MSVRELAQVLPNTDLTSLSTDIQQATFVRSHIDTIVLPRGTFHSFETKYIRNVLSDKLSSAPWNATNTLDASITKDHLLLFADHIDEKVKELEVNVTAVLNMFVHSYSTSTSDLGNVEDVEEQWGSSGENDLSLSERFNMSLVSDIVSLYGASSFCFSC